MKLSLTVGESAGSLGSTSWWGDGELQMCAYAAYTHTKQYEFMEHDASESDGFRKRPAAEAVVFLPFPAVGGHFIAWSKKVRNSEISSFLNSRSNPSLAAANQRSRRSAALVVPENTSMSGLRKKIGCQYWGTAEVSVS